MPFEWEGFLAISFITETVFSTRLTLLYNLVFLLYGEVNPLFVYI